MPLPLLIVASAAVGAIIGTVIGFLSVGMYRPTSIPVRWPVVSALVMAVIGGLVWVGIRWVGDGAFPAGRDLAAGLPAFMVMAGAWVYIAGSRARSRTQQS